MRIPLFKMERMQSTHENCVEYNLSESGVHFYTGARRENMPVTNGGAEANQGTGS